MICLIVGNITISSVLWNLACDVVFIISVFSVAYGVDCAYLQSVADKWTEMLCERSACVNGGIELGCQCQWGMLSVLGYISYWWIDCTWANYSNTSRGGAWLDRDRRLDSIAYWNALNIQGYLSSRVPHSWGHPSLLHRFFLALLLLMSLAWCGRDVSI